ncbi:MAG: hypothetical protein FWD57_10110, partial [Polyangiaceae bacterium]|nr:hypothetical protein [Polyangiaceae bacterium]
CWGNNDHGQVGIGSSVPAVLVPTALAMNKIVAISSGLRHSCATAEDGDVKCWGSNYFDQLGCVTCSILERSPVAPYHLGNVSYLAAGQQNTCVVDPATDLLCWGDNEFHQSGGASAGAGETVFWPSYAFLSPFDRVSEVNKVMSGGTSTCYSMIGFGRDIYCFGSNTDGQLLADPLVYQSSFYPLRTALTASVVQNNIFDIQLGEKHGCLHSDMGVFCWGSNTFGQLGDGSVSSRHTAHQVSSLGSDSGVMRISCSNSNHCCALWKKGGSTGVKCWGNNSAHQVGVPRLADAFEVLPQNVNGFPPI